MTMKPKAKQLELTGSDGITAENLEYSSGVSIKSEIDDKIHVKDSGTVDIVSGTVKFTGTGINSITNVSGEAVIDISGGSGSSLEVTDGTTPVTNVDKITFSGATTVDNSNGDVTVTIDEDTDKINTVPGKESEICIFLSDGNIESAGITIADFDASVVHVSENESISGIKTFSDSPIVPTPTTDYQTATKKYVDDNAGGGTASGITTDTTNFNNNLSSADDNVQKALDTLDDLVSGSVLEVTDGNTTVNNVDKITFNNLNLSDDGNQDVTISGLLGITNISNISLGNDRNASTDNISIGISSLMNNMYGSKNIAIGNESLKTMTSANRNVSIGQSALYSNNGDDNIAIGISTLFSNSSGINNTALGNFSGYSNSSGSSNIFIGYESGMYQNDGTTDLTDPENSIYIGADCRGYDNNDNNTIVIGYQAIGQGTNTVVIGNDNITDTYLKGNVHADNLAEKTTPRYEQPTVEGVAGSRYLTLQYTPILETIQVIYSHLIYYNGSIITPPPSGMTYYTVSGKQINWIENGGVDLTSSDIVIVTYLTLDTII